MIIPTGPKSDPEASITINISKGWDFTLFEKIKGWLKKLSINWPTKKPIITKIVFGRIIVLKSAPIKLLIVNKIIKIPPMIGPRYGIKFNKAQRNAIINAFSTLKTAKTML